MRFLKNAVYTGLRKFLEPRYGKKKYQPFFETLYRMSLIGMNIGGGTNVADSGELNVLHYIKSRLSTSKRPNGCVIFDVGANIGDYSLLLAEVFRDQAQIYSFEPSVKTYKKLSENTVGKVKGSLHNFGFGDAPSRATLYSDIDASGLASVYKRKLEH